MPYPTAHLLMSFGGKLFVTEQWNCNLRLAASPDQVPTNDYDTMVTYAADNAAAAHAKVKTWWQIAGVAQLMGAQTTLLYTKFNAIAQDGKYLDTDNANTIFETGDGVAGTGTVLLPAQCCVAVTLTTGATRGLAHQGRIYLPTLTMAMQSNGMASNTSIPALVGHVVTLLNSLNTLPALLGSPPKVTIISKGRFVGQPGETVGLKHLVTGVKCGGVIDTQRRRRSNLVETYTAVSPVT